MCVYVCVCVYVYVSSFPQNCYSNNWQKDGGYDDLFNFLEKTYFWLSVQFKFGPI